MPFSLFNRLLCEINGAVQVYYLHYFKHQNNY